MRSRSVTSASVPREFDDSRVDASQPIFDMIASLLFLILPFLLLFELNAATSMNLEIACFHSPSSFLSSSSVSHLVFLLIFVGSTMFLFIFIFMSNDSAKCWRDKHSKQRASRVVDARSMPLFSARHCPCFSLLFSEGPNVAACRNQKCHNSSSLSFSFFLALPLFFTFLLRATLPTLFTFFPEGSDVATGFLLRATSPLFLSFLLRAMFHI